MGSNFSTDITSGIGISLGGLEIATSFLFANPEFYEGELNETKSSPSAKVHVVKPNKPRVTKQNILDKFAIVPKTTIGVVSDTVIDSGDIVLMDDNFDSDFDNFETDVEANTVDDSTIDSIDENEAKALDLMKRLQDLDNNTISNEDDNEFDLSDIDSLDNNSQVADETDEFSDIDNIDVDEADEFSDIDNIDIDEGIDLESDDGLEIDGLDDLEDSSELGDEQESNIESEYNDDIELEDNDDIELDDNIESEDNDDIELDDNIESEDNDDIELDDNIELEDENTEYEEDDINTDEGISLDNSNIANASINLDDDNDFDINGLMETGDKQVEIKHTDSVQEVSPDKSNDVQQCNINIQKAENNNNENKELEEMRKRVAFMEKQMQQMLNSKASNDTSILSDKDNFNKKIEPAKIHKQTEQQPSNYDRYTAMNIDVLFKEVKKYMISMGVEHKLIDLAILNNKFGADNIKKLTKKSYLISIGKGVTTGR